MTPAQLTAGADAGERESGYKHDLETRKRMAEKKRRQRERKRREAAAEQTATAARVFETQPRVPARDWRAEPFELKSIEDLDGEGVIDADPDAGAELDELAAIRARAANLSGLGAAVAALLTSQFAAAVARADAAGMPLPMLSSAAEHRQWLEAAIETYHESAKYTVAMLMPERLQQPGGKYGPAIVCVGGQVVAQGWAAVAEKRAGEGGHPDAPRAANDEAPSSPAAPPAPAEPSPPGVEPTAAGDAWAMAFKGDQ